ncbi:MAG: protein kinase [Sandaracinaceae bacterium]|nr:protein kinase [Sandaracinaceae bacterium]
MEEEAFDQELLGRTLGGTYRIDALLGSGGMGAVFRATHLRTSRPYAVKVLLPEVAVRRDAMRRFRREAEAVGALGHANVVAIHDFDVADGWAYLVMDLLDGEDLSARLTRVGRLPVHEAVELLTGIGAGLGAAHARGLVHRDLKPANVFLARQAGAPERPVLLDFGLAKSLAQETGMSQLTASGVVMGTPQYMSPEQASGLPLDERADLYSLATIFYEMLAGQPPFSAPTVPALFAKLATDPAPPLDVHRPDVPPALSAVLSHALAKSADHRYPTAEQLVHAVRAAVHGASLPPSVPSGFPPTMAAEAGPTPVGNAAASWPRGIDPHAQTQATPDQGAPRALTPALPAAPARASGGSAWLVVLLTALVGAAVLGVAGGGYLYWLQVRSTRQQLEAIERSLPRGPDPAAVQRAIEEAARSGQPPVDPPVAPVAEEPVMEPVAPAPVEPVAAEPPAEPERVPRRRRRAVEPTTPPAAPTPAEATPVAPTSGRPPGGPPAGVEETVEYMGRGDYAGCIRESRRHPRSIQLLGARMSCAIHGNDDAELRSTCGEIRQHYPDHAYNRTCDSMMQVRGLR